tara:strand:- start:662 stop:838 length:177 start_codon:yes stop_codon:yes gene_type:complete
MEEYVYIKVKLVLKPGQTEDTVQEIVQECHYEFSHYAGEIIEHEIIDIHDYQVSKGGE